MNFTALLAAFLTITHFGRFAFIILSLWKFYTTDQKGFFYAYIVVFGLNYIIQIILMANNVANAILSIFSLQFIRIPFIVGKPKYRNRIIYLTCFELINALASGYLSSYLAIQTKRLPLWISIPQTVLSVIDIPIFFDGILFNHPMIMPLLHYFMLMIEHFLSIAFSAVIITLRRFWIVYCVGCWRFILLFEPYAFWCSLYTVVSPFRAMDQCKCARSLVAIYLLYMENFLMIYVTIWYMKKNIINQVFAYIYASVFLIFFIYQILSSNLPFTHKIKPITWASKEEPQMFDPAVL